MAKERLDVLLVNGGHYETRQQAQRGIMAGLVRVNGERADKPGTRFLMDVDIEVIGKEHPYVSRGGLKLARAIEAFALDLSHKTVLDIGASTGGFADCSLMNGAARVYAVDVGYNQLAWKLRQDPRVVVMERTNFRHMKPEDLKGDRPDFATIDVSFISLSKILPPLKELLVEHATVVALVKPQFEAGKGQVGKKGVVRDPEIHRQVLQGFVDLVRAEGFGLRGLISSPIKGGEGNVEFLGCLTWPDEQGVENEEALISTLVKEVHNLPKN
ncbi:23S rRNA (cytidine1920-2'-O)/16S rRNA (cytidine1409-2'-O)-methyltransferase [Marininema mesophilum]|uniref:23S rRNA (Cytidine1920-2'-O)/16S rRNA (Cytidine1409-2'-O)-methyltransferase n=1 Tax=Marininema mesophilum TaxID=1048340 RepID=A0A1H2UDU5_9BACL|nr:TlyA family RNA methyltransferase [Marininema mesophilum]SDW54088.1 23S rRNA (cytidine1920-2'-O)/16S rRNA (cytidine1409-2'-O)-methyltransferase [Marininema mesophilum]